MLTLIQTTSEVNIEQAIIDGYLIDLSTKYQTRYPRIIEKLTSLGLRVGNTKIVITKAVFERYVEVPQRLSLQDNEVERLWDVLIGLLWSEKLPTQQKFAFRVITIPATENHAQADEVDFVDKSNLPTKFHKSCWLIAIPSKEHIVLTLGQEKW